MFLRIVFCIALFGLGACAKSSSSLGEEGTLRVRLQVNPQVVIDLKSTDVTTFSLDVMQGDRVVKRVSPIGDVAEPISLEAGVYTVRAYSQNFTVPAFDMPVYEGSESVTITSGNETSTTVVCSQSNAGVQIEFSETFQMNHENYFVSISQIEGSLTYTSDDIAAGRIGYFLPGEAVITVTADGVKYEQTIDLEARRVYEVLIDDAPYEISGDLNVGITVDLDVTTENISILFPSGVVDYSETAGDVPVSSQVVVGYYTGWSNRDVGYDGLDVYVAAESNFSDSYTGASGGNYLLFRKEGAWLTLSGINTSAAASDMVLSFGCRAESTCDLNTSLTVSVSRDGVAFTQLAIPDQQLNTKWKIVSYTEGIPLADNLIIRIESNTSVRCMIDDLSLKTL